jgi:hypothetical protein
MERHPEEKDRPHIPGSPSLSRSESCDGECSRGPSPQVDDAELGQASSIHSGTRRGNRFFEPDNSPSDDENDDTVIEMLRQHRAYHSSEARQSHNSDSPIIVACENERPGAKDDATEKTWLVVKTDRAKPI